LPTVEEFCWRPPFVFFSLSDYHLTYFHHPEMKTKRLSTEVIPRHGFVLPGNFPVLHSFHSVFEGYLSSRSNSFVSFCQSFPVFKSNFRGVESLSLPGLFFQQFSTMFPPEFARYPGSHAKPTFFNSPDLLVDSGPKWKPQRIFPVPRFSFYSPYLPPNVPWLEPEPIGVPRRQRMFFFFFPVQHRFLSPCQRYPWLYRGLFSFHNGSSESP